MIKNYKKIEIIILPKIKLQSFFIFSKPSRGIKNKTISINVYARHVNNYFFVVRNDI